MSRCGHEPPKPACLECFKAGRTAAWVPATGAPPVRCTRLGLEVIGLCDCPSCKGRVRRKEYACAAGLGTRGRAVPAVDCGAHCPGWSPSGGSA